MKVKLVYHTPLWVASKAIRKCWSSEDKSDTCNTNDNIGIKDRELIYRVGNKFKHASTLEHLNYTFDIDGISRACLQELARHRHASMSVKSTRYTLKELKQLDGNVENIKPFFVRTGNETVDITNQATLVEVREALKEGISNDIAKYMLPEAYKTSLVWTVNARSLQNFLSLRTDKAALWEIRELANEIFRQLPEEHKYLFKEFVKVYDG